MYPLLIFITGIYHSVLLTIIFYLRKIGKMDQIDRLGKIYSLVLIPAIINMIVNWQTENIADLSFHFIFVGYLIIAISLDQVFRIDFRSRMAILIPYIVLYYMANFSVVALTWMENEVAGIIMAVLVLVQISVNLYSHVGFKEKAIPVIA